MTVTNLGNVTDTFDLAASGQIWETTLSTSQVVLEPGESTQVDVFVRIPLGAAPGASDMVTITVTSQGDPGAEDSGSLTTTALTTLKTYMPLLQRE